MLSQRLIDHEADTIALEEAIKPYMRFLAWFQYEGSDKRQVPPDFNPNALLPPHVFFDRFDVYPGDYGAWCVVFYFNFYGNFGAEWHNAYSMPIEWLDLPLEEFLAKLRQQQEEKTEEERRKIKAKETAKRAEQRKEYEKLKAVFEPGGQGE